VLRYKRLARQWHVRAPGFKSPQLHQAQRILRSPFQHRLPAIHAYLSMAASHLPEPDGSGSRRSWLLAWKQPRAVGAGKRGLGRPARHNASAATGAARGCPGRLATDGDHQSGRAGYRLEGGVGRRTVMRVVPSSSRGPPGRWSPPRTPPSSGPSHATACRPARHPRRLLLAC
jgi:hypothetical protein